MTKVVLWIIVLFGNTQTSTKFEMTSVEHCETQAVYVTNALKAEGYSDWNISTLCVMEK